MASVDDRVVAMKFDNSSFEQKVSTTITSLEKLNNSLSLSNAKTGFSGITAASNSVNLSGIANATQTIAAKFDAMGAIALSVISNITKRAVDAGIQLAKSLSLAQVTAGFADYELKVGATQTIMAGTGEGIDAVTASLKELDTYADKTVYNLADMVGNIGKFTNAGVKLPLATKSMIGIANAAALAGANSGEAARAMYNLGQAIGQGTVRLIDWKSVELANMGTMEFKQQLMDSAVAMGTLKKSADGVYTTVAKGTVVTTKNFSTTLDDLWLTSEALTGTLAQYADQTTAIGKKAWAAAQNVKTFSMMMETLKASISTGWTDTFEILVGNLPEATALWTSLTNAMGTMVGASADARNSMLKGWKDLGGRTKLIAGVTSGFEAFGAIITKIKEAFRDIFPEMTSKRLYALTVAFQKFMKELMPSNKALFEIHRAFQGLFAAFSIGFEITKGMFGLFKSLFGIFTDALGGGGGILKWFATLGDSIVELQKVLVVGHGIDIFFANITKAISKFFTGLSFDNVVSRILGLLTRLKDAIFGLFTNSNTKVGAEFEKMLGRMQSRFAPLVTVVRAIGKAWDWFIGKLDTIKTALGKFGDFIKEAFSNIPQAIAKVFANTDYSTVLDTVNVGLFAGLVLLFKKFVKNGFKIDIGGGIFDKLKAALDGLTGTLSAMQTKLKAEALKQIAIALGLLTISIVILSMIDSAALTKATVAVGMMMGQLVLSMGLLNKVISGPRDAAKLSALGLALLLIAGSLAVMSIAMKIFSTMSWEDIAKGMTAVTGLLVVLAGAMEQLSGVKGMVRAGLGLIAVAVALTILAVAVKLFSMMSWAEMGKGLAGVAGGLIILVEAMKLMPGGLITKGLGLMAIAVALNILAAAVKLFSMMSWKELGKGFAAVAAALLIIAGAMKIMPNGISLALQGTGLLAIGLGLIAIATAVKIMSTMSWKELATGLTALAAVLVILAVASNAMSGAIGGAIAIGIISLSLGQLAKGLKEFAGLKWSELLKGLVAIAAVLALFAAAAYLIGPILPQLIGLGIALALIGAGFALFGIGANMVATAFAIIATSGSEGVATLLSALDGLILRLPELILAFGDGILMLAQKIVEAAPVFIAGLSTVITALLQLLIDNIPKLGQTLVTLILEALKVLETVFPQVVATGFKLLMELLRGINDNIVQITNMVINIILKFIGALTERLDEIVAAGLNFLVSFLNGISQNLGKVVTALAGIITAFVGGITTLAESIIAAGTKFIVKIIEGFAKGGKDILSAMSTMITQFIGGITTLATDIMAAGTKFIIKIIAGFGKAIVEIANAMGQFVVDVLNGLATVIRERGADIRAAGVNLIGAVIDGMTGGLASKGAGFLKSFGGFVGGIAKKGMSVLGINSPSLVFKAMGEGIIEGLALGIDNDGSKAINSVDILGQGIINAFQSTLSQIPTALDGLNEFNPTITPVLDLTQVQKEAGNLGSILGSGSTLTAQASYKQAASLAITSQPLNDTQPTPGANKEVQFVQNNYSPESLSTADIYRQTRNQIALAKKELAVV